MTEQGQNPIEVVGDSLQNAQDALREAKSWCVGGVRQPITKALSELYLVTARPSEGAVDRTAMLAVLTEKLLAYPTDLVLAAIANYRGKFFPTLEDLRGPIESSFVYQRRLLVRAALQAAVERLTAGGRPRPEPERDRAAVNAGFRRLAEELRKTPETASREASGVRKND